MAMADIIPSENTVSWTEKNFKVDTKEVFQTKMKTRLERIAACDEAAERHVKELQNMLQELKELKNDEYGYSEYLWEIVSDEDEYYRSQMVISNLKEAINALNEAVEVHLFMAKQKIHEAKNWKSGGEKQ